MDHITAHECVYVTAHQSVCNSPCCFTATVQGRETHHSGLTVRKNSIPEITTFSNILLWPLNLVWNAQRKPPTPNFRQHIIYNTILHPCIRSWAWFSLASNQSVSACLHIYFQSYTTHSLIYYIDSCFWKRKHIRIEIRPAEWEKGKWLRPTDLELVRAHFLFLH